MSLQIDETAFVEAAQGSNNLQFKDEKQQARFELGVSMMVYRWDALDIAVENKWGGPDSAGKRDWITAVICDAFKSEKIIDVAYIEEILLYAMVDEFDTNVEDDSALPVASGIIDLYKQCDSMDYSGVEHLYTEFEQKQKSKASSSNRIVHIENDPLNPDTSSSEEDEDDLEEEDVEMDIDTETTVNAAPEPIVDDDGFELVQKKGRRRQ
ncbi:hypothetical protein Kpol_1001p20 [Vanderwaltozyma polyspora DSM 70294]|uniref:Pre-rRNA-processing protein TSR2 n=1 Tax=Vanderwaltozyma polyspora (strain ATCC 22028 / DSM 70294 / BCRC 21397 / CBS 2163 / NBRC 10782 / NRRL Y-8283 / UCD 57-17) TaxID=436907 RepID=A7TNQ7_VANPO|nr:uncharacterized protein Kpol_1001p20 [Vanderwaltozyma polyspora DSM 70294]EDO16108.1 hypothetical protein Kpol_1001p20 [Vanderwaltozyma polyspora DSM 70294]